MMDVLLSIIMINLEQYGYDMIRLWQIESGMFWYFSNYINYKSCNADCFVVQVGPGNKRCFWSDLFFNLPQTNRQSFFRAYYLPDQRPSKAWSQDVTNEVQNLWKPFPIQPEILNESLRIII